jgi:hypothetical protein
MDQLLILNIQNRIWTDKNPSKLDQIRIDRKISVPFKSLQAAHQPNGWQISPAVWIWVQPISGLVFCVCNNLVLWQLYSVIHHVTCMQRPSQHKQQVSPSRSSVAAWQVFLFYIIGPSYARNYLPRRTRAPIKYTKWHNHFLCTVVSWQIVADRNMSWQICPPRVPRADRNGTANSPPDIVSWQIVADPPNTHTHTHTI